MGGRKKHQADQRADLRGSGFIGLPIVVHKSDAYRSLTPFERAVLTEILAAFNGYNNGEIAVSHRQIADALGNSNFRKISRAIVVLIERGLLDIATDAVWKQRLAREYRLTFITSRKPPFTQPASNDYLLWGRNGADTVSAERRQSADGASANSILAVDSPSARPVQKPQKCGARSKISADDASALIVKPYQGPKTSTGLKRRKLAHEFR